MKYRIVHNPLTDRYRVEKRGLFGWSFVTERKTGAYLDFDNAGAACRWIRDRAGNDDIHRRWRVVSNCCA